MSGTALSSALEVADLGLRVFPAVPGKKIPAMEGWQEAATTDPLTIQQWFTEKPYSNYGIRTGLANNIIVIDLDGEEARKWWKSTGIEDSSAIVYSPRKDGGVTTTSVSTTSRLVIPDPSSTQA
ncbi:bifunctional DNA primase/polymerase [Leucobacter viscericola]|uniref:bifunctional DNA primase/polymerase n=1 Tax=Leucobacter viscericola TaxID=2714935 RepID=UPI00244DDCCF|nr:bifunctional DNA primase/polymerase [Leucobacter viscericola]